MVFFNKKYYLNYEIFDTYLEVFISDGNNFIECEKWNNLKNVYLSKDKTNIDKDISTNIYISLVDDDLAQKNGDYRLKINYKDIVCLSNYKVYLMGLPELISHSLNIKCIDSPNSDNFKLTYQFINQQGQELPCFKVDGIFIEISRKVYILKQPFYSIVEKINLFNQSKFNNLEDKMFAWAQIKALFSNDITSDKFLKEFTVYVPDAFTLKDSLDSSGELTFNPILYNKMNDIYGVEQVDIQTLPEIYQQNFEKYFNKRDVSSAYALGQGNYTILSDNLRRTLKLVKKYKKCNVKDRKKFFSNPRIFLREEFESVLDEEKINDLFIETDQFADRVREIGLWQPPVIPFLKQAKTPWLPPEEIGIIINGEKIAIEPENLDSLIDNAKKLLESDKNTFSIDCKEIKITPEIIEKLHDLKNKYEENIRFINNDNKVDLQENKEKTDSLVTSGDRIALLILRNIKDVELITKKRKVVNKEIENLDLWFQKALKSKPMNHQIEGFNWLLRAYLRGFSGSLLADDMGLGKTFQSLCFLMFLKDMMKNKMIKEKPFLIVAPTGLIKNWEDEHNFHLKAEGLGDITRAYGRYISNLKINEAKRTKELDKGVSILNKSKLNRSDIVITTYETMRDYQHSFGKIKWGTIIFDEIQKMKNPKALVTDAGKAMNTDFVLALTGTPVENHISDLWCILDRVRPGYFGSLKGFLNEYSMKDINRIKHLKSLLTDHDETTPPVMIRRMKDDSLKGLPEIGFKTVREIMPEKQAKQYTTAVFDAKKNNKRGAMLKALQKFRSISLIPDQKIYKNVSELIDQSARLKVTFRILDEIYRKKEKALIFIESKDVQSYLVEIITSKYKLKKQPLIINGSVPGRQRKDRVDIFQSGKGFDVMLLSPKAGGVGLTLTAANNVIHLSRWWNPAVEDQCTDRVYRIGQNKAVSVYYPLAVHPEYGDMSFDIKLSELLQKKRNLSKAILAPVSVTDNDLKSLFESATQINK